MDKQQIVVGLDIGTTKIACLIGVKDENKPGKIKIIGHGKVASVGVVHGVVKNILQTAETIKHAVTLAAEEAKCSVTEVYVGIAGQHIKNMKNRGMVGIPAGQEYITEADIKRLIEEQRNVLLDPGDEIIHIFPQTFLVDNDELKNVDPIGVSGKQLAADFHIVTGNQSNIKNIIQSVKLAGLAVKDIVLEPIASSMAVLTHEDIEAGVALVDIGGGTTDLAIFANGVICHTHVIPVAGQTITDDIQKGCTVLRDTAEKLKVQFGSCMPESLNNDVVSFPGYHGMPPREIAVRTLAGIIKARTEDIIDLVNYEIIQSRMEKQLVGGIVLTGGGSKLKDIVNYTSYKTGINARIGTPDEHLSSFGDKKGEGISDPIYATGIGLVLYGFEKLKEEEKKEQPTQKTKEEDPILDEEKDEEIKTRVETKENGNNGWLSSLRKKFDTWLTDESID